MRRRITLYLGGQPADLSDGGFVLLNVALQDLTNPAVVRNSWTQSVDLPRTPANDAIFGSSGRLDRNAGDGGTGTDFNASRRLPFSIYLETGEVLFAGYAKLDAVTGDAYRVSLYGGLGDFLYGLSYDSDGTKRSLASLDYGEDLDFDITAQTVQEAWDRLGGDSAKPAKWDIINFAPCYNGIPDDFNADKALINTDLLGFIPPVTMDGVSCDATKGGGYAMLNIPSAIDEWQAHDLRSYHQRPVLSVLKLLAAIADPLNNGGWAVDISDIITKPHVGTWLTRPLLPSLGTYKQTSGSATVTFQSYASGTIVGRFSLANLPAGTDVTARVRTTLQYTVPGASPNTPLRSWDYKAAQSYVPDGYEQQVLFVQAVAYASDNSMVAAGPVKSYYKSYNQVAPATLAAACGYTPKDGADFLPAEDDHGYSLTGGVYQRQRDLEVEVTGADIDRIDIEVTAYRCHIATGGSVFSTYGGTTSFQILWYDSDNAYNPTAAAAVAGSGSATFVTGDSLRSGAHITKEMLLSTDGTPADYLLAICKAFGFHIIADAASRSVRILSRASFYDGTTVDLTGRVDKTSVEIQPIAFDAKWYEWKWPSAGGRFEKEYQETGGVQYGIQRVDTGYDFDADTKDVLGSSVLKSCASVQERGPHWYYASDIGTGRFWFGPVMTPGTEYVLWDSAGEDHSAPATAPTDAATFTPYNATFPGYDVSDRAEFRDADNKALDGSDVLLFHQGGATPDDFSLTDDTPAMDTLLGGPCWLIEVNNAGQYIPHFSRYRCLIDIQTLMPQVITSLDFGIPREIDIPGLIYKTGTIYGTFWRDYIHDRLSVHGKVMRAQVLLDGLQVGPELLRKFFWYGGSLWVLVSVSNYSLTTFDPAECEFVQVRDTNAYV